MREGLHRGLQIFVTLIGTAALTACDGSSNTYVPPPPPAVRVAQPVQEPITLYFDLTGNTAPLNSVDIEARVQGYLQSIDYQDGTTVTKGTKLFGIERDTYQAQLDQAKASLASQQASQVGAKQEYDRQVNLMKQQVTTQTAVDSAKATLDEANASILNAQANLELATINLGYTEVLAPFDGTATNHLVDIGTLVGVSGPTKLAEHRPDGPDLCLFQRQRNPGAADQGYAEKAGTHFQADGPAEHPCRTRPAIRGRLSAQGTSGLRLAATRCIDRHASGPGSVRQQGQGHAARPLRARSRTDRPE